MRLLAILAAGSVALWVFLRGYAPSTPSTGTPDVDSGSGRGVMQDALDNFTQATANFEGAQPWLNNPGNIKATRNPYPGQVGVSDAGFAEFGDIGDGWDKLSQLTQAKALAHPGWDFYDFFGNWVNGDTTNTAGNVNNYAEYVAQYLGVDPTSSVAQTLGLA